MKVAQKNPTNPNTRSVHLSHASSMLNMELSPSGHLSDTGPEPGKHSRLTSPLAGIVWHRVRTRLALHVFLLCTCLLSIYCFFFLFSPVDPETNAGPVIDYVDDDPSLPEQPGKPPLWSSQYRPFHSLMLALDFATVIVCSYSDA